MFSGQGSQYYQMGRELFENHSRFKIWMKHCDAIVEPMLGRSLIDIIYQDGRSKMEPFDELRYTNPAILCFEYCLTKILMESKIEPDYLLGYSFGELTSLVVSGAISLQDGLRFSIDIAELIQADSQQAGMLAIIDSTAIIDEYPHVFESCWLTAKNFNNSFVVGGLESDIVELHEFLNDRKIVNQLLPVKYGFHTKLMEPLKPKIIELFNGINCSSGRIPMLSSLKPNKQVSITAEHIWQVFRYPVDFSGTLNFLLQYEDYIFIDVGPSGTLATFVKYICNQEGDSQYLEVINQFGRDLDSLNKLKNSLLVAA
jgi:acyl transferase domain-containing protein